MISQRKRELYFAPWPCEATSGRGTFVRYCISCGAQLRAGIKFCTSCGADVADPPTEALSVDDAMPTRLSTSLPRAEPEHRGPVFPRPPVSTPPPTQVISPPVQPVRPVQPVQPVQQVWGGYPSNSGPIPSQPTVIGMGPGDERGGPSWALVVGIVVVVLAIAGTVIAVVATRKSGTSANSGVTTGPGSAATSQPVATTDGSSSGGGSGSGSGSTTGQQQQTTAPVQPQSVTVGTVTITPVRNNSQARKVARTFDWYFSSINEGDYSRAAEALTDHEAPNDPTTQDSNIVLQRLYYRGGQLLATITFRSHQARRWAPDGASTCIDWRLTFPVESSYNFLPYQLGRPVHVGQPYVSCGY